MVKTSDIPDYTNMIQQFHHQPPTWHPLQHCHCQCSIRNCNEIMAASVHDIVCRSAARPDEMIVSSLFRKWRQEECWWWWPAIAQDQPLAAAIRQYSGQLHDQPRSTCFLTSPPIVLFPSFLPLSLGNLLFLCWNKSDIIRQSTVNLY